MHRDHVPSVPPSFQLLGSSPICPVQGLVRLYSTDTRTSPPPSTSPSDATWDASTIHILTLQGHPEFTAPMVSAIIDVREANGAMSAEVVRDGRARAVREHEGIGSIGRAIWRVLGVDAKPWVVRIRCANQIIWNVGLWMYKLQYIGRCNPMKFCNTYLYLRQADFLSSVFELDNCSRE